jgi:hypothetical protein
VLQLLEQLEALQAADKTFDPVSDPLLNGWWALVYQGPVDEARAARDRSGTLEGPFLAAFQPLTQGLVRTRASTQLIDLLNGRAENVSEFEVLGGRWRGALNIQGTAQPLPPRPVRAAILLTEFGQGSYL